MFPTAKKRKGLSSGVPPRKDRFSKSPKRNVPERRQHTDKTGKGWKKTRDGGKPFGKKMKPSGRTSGTKKVGGRDNKFGGRNRFEGKKDKSFKSKSQKAKPSFKKRGAGAKKGFKHRKGKG